MVMRISKDRVDLDDKVLQKPVFKDYGETVVAANSSTSYTVNLTLGNVFDITLTGNCVFTFSNPSASGTACSFTVILTQDNTGSRTATWPAAVKWPGGTPPTLFTNPDSVNLLTFVTVNGGAAYFGTDGGGNEALPPIVYLPYGYFGGGITPSFTYLTTVDRIDYANDTATAVAKGPLTAARYGLAATGTSTYGYFGGGYIAPAAHSTVDRLDYANDTATTVAKGPLSLARYSLAATGTSSYGYFGGGVLSPSVRSTVDRLDYANDTATAVAKGPLSVARSGPAATGTSSYGYFGGGWAPGTRSTVDRLDYANETATTVAKGPLSAARYLFAATGNSTYGYFGGGAVPAARSTIDRIDYANDTATAVAKGPLSLARILLSASGNAAYGYFGGGESALLGTGYSTVDRLDYSNDTTTAVAKGPLSLTRYGVAATQNCPL